jgi:protocatechuate 3,4-dioxygenase beta subunit
MTGDADCRPWVEQDEGPYHLDGQPFREVLVDDRTGVALDLGITLRHDDGTPVVGAVVDVWHCDALGRYSGITPPGSTEHFLRGRQPTDTDGHCQFRTVYPGWYGGRTVHIHVIVDVDGRRLTTQLFFPDELNAELLARPPYGQRPGRDTTNATDEIFANQGEETLLSVRAHQDGYQADICFQLTPDRNRIRHRPTPRA